MINPQSVQTLILGIQDNLTTLANSLGSLGDSFELHMACGSLLPIIDGDGKVWIPNGFTDRPFSTNLFTPVRDLYPMYPFLWNTSYSNFWHFVLPVPQGVYQFRYWFLNPDDNDGGYDITLSLNGLELETNINLYSFCGGAKLPKSKVYPTFQVMNNQPVVIHVTEAGDECPITAFELYKIGEIP